MLYVLGGCRAETSGAWDAWAGRPPIRYEAVKASLFDRNTGRRLLRLTHGARYTASVPFRLSPDGRWVGAAAGNTVLLYDGIGRNHRHAYQFTDEPISDLAFSPDGLTAAVASPSEVVVFDLDS